VTGLVDEMEHQLGPLDDIPVGEGRAYAVGDLQIAVFRLRNGALRATQAVCPHAGGPLADGQLDDSVVLCPLHTAAFDLETGAARTGGPPLTVYPVRVVDGSVTVTTRHSDPT
jgi:nitrite reductase/ring-hydroxylating ferredoxin subunit